MPITPRGLIRVGFIGAGSCISEYFKVLDRLIGSGVCAEGPICVRRADAWPALISRRPSATLVRTADEVLAADVDVAVVITRDDSHAEYVRLALTAGVHVLVERPIALTLQEAMELKNLAAMNKRWLVSGPVVHLSPTFQEVWAQIRNEAIGHPHFARAFFGTAGFTWAPWQHSVDSGGILGNIGTYHLKSLTTLLGPVTNVAASVEETLIKPRVIGAHLIENPVPDLSVVVLRHRGGALSTIANSSAIQAYRRPAALELYGTRGTINVLGEDWRPVGYELWSGDNECWEFHGAPDECWSWCDGLRDLAEALRDDRAPIASIDQDLHLLDVALTARQTAITGRSSNLATSFEPLSLVSNS
jgi:predicted dehydrogenase